MGQWELDLPVVELLDCQLAALTDCSVFHLLDLGRGGPGTVLGAQVSIALGDSACSGQVPILRCMPWVLL